MAQFWSTSLRYHTCRSSHPEDRKLPITDLKWDARTVTNIPGNTAHCFFAFFWLTEGSRNKSGRSKLSAVEPLWLNFGPLPVSRIAWHTCIIPQNVCTCLCFINIYSKTVYHPEDRKLPITELKYDARTVTNIPGNTAHYFFAFFWLTRAPEIKTRYIY
jgi:hypothetical protein